MIYNFFAQHNAENKENNYTKSRLIQMGEA